jgi:hypothetical protein
MVSGYDRVGVRGLVTLLLGVLLSAAPAAAACPGDCNGDGVVSASSLTKIISIMVLCPGEPAAGCPAVPGDDKQCTAADINGDGTISAAEMTTVIKDIIEYPTGCPPPGVATPTVPPALPTATPLPAVATPTQPTAPTATPPSAPTATLPAAPTPTPTLPAAPTATQPAVATPTLPPAATPTPTTGGAGLGVRVFNINSKASASKFYTSVLTGLSATTGVQGSLKLVAGPKAADGTAALSLQEDAFITVPLVQGQGTVCFKLFKEGTSGTLDCDGGAPGDAVVTVDSHGAGPNGEPVWATAGTGTAGAATLTVVQAGTTPQTGTIDCKTQTFGTPASVIYATGKTTATVINPAPGSPGISGDKITATWPGKSFDCAAWTTTGSPGTLVVSILGLDAVTSPGTAPVDTVNTLLIVDAAPTATPTAKPTATPTAK